MQTVPDCPRLSQTVRVSLRFDFVPWWVEAVRVRPTLTQSAADKGAVSHKPHCLAHPCPTSTYLDHVIPCLRCFWDVLTFCSYLLLRSASCRWIEDPSWLSVVSRLLICASGNELKSLKLPLLVTNWWDCQNLHFQHFHCPVPKLHYLHFHHIFNTICQSRKSRTIPKAQHLHKLNPLCTPSSI